MKCRFWSSEIEIFEDEVTAEEKNKATCDLHDLGIPVYGRPKATLHAEELVKLCFGEVDNVMVCKQKPTSVRTNAVFVVDLRMYCTTANLLLSPFLDVTVEMILWNVIPFADNVAWCVPYCRLTKCVKLC
jgi:hypothetical protein